MTTAYNFPDLDISPIDQDISTASGGTVNASEIINMDSSITIEITPPPEEFPLLNRRNEENQENSFLARIDEEISDFENVFEFPLDSPSRRGAPTTEDEGNYSSEEVFQRLEKDARKILCASHSIEENEIGFQDGNCMSNTILRGITAYVDFQCCMESAKTVKSKLRQMGAVVQRRMSATVSHVIFSRGGRKSTLQTVLSLDPRPFLLDPHWVHSCYFNQFRAPEESYSLYGCKYLVNSLRRASLDPEGSEPIEDSLNQIELSPEDDLAPGKKTTVPLPRSNSTVSLSESAELTFDQPMTATQLLTKIDALSKKLDRLAADDTAALAHGKRCPSRQSLGGENVPQKTVGTSMNQFIPKQTLPLRRRTHGAFGLAHRVPYSNAVKEIEAFREATAAESGIMDITNRLNTVALAPVLKKVNGIDDMRRTQAKNLNQIHKTLQNNSKFRRKKPPVKVVPDLPAIFENLDETEESLLRTPRVPLQRPVVNTASGIINQLQNVPSSDEFAAGVISRVKKRGIIFTGFNREEESLLKEAASFLELRVQTKIDQGTRCVISHRGQRTLATLKSVCMGIPVVKPEWLQTCEKEDKLVGLRHFAYPQWQRVLQPAKSTLFRRLGPILVVDGCSPPSEDLKWMIKKCGGELVNSANEADLIICPENREVQIPWTRTENNRPPLIVQERYILDCITQGRLLILADYSDVSITVIDSE